MSKFYLATALEIYNAVGFGKKNAMSRANLAIKVKLSPRSVRLYMHKMKEYRLIILSTTQTGVYKPSMVSEQAIQELREYEIQQTNYIRRFNDNIKAAKKLRLKLENTNQVEMG